GFLAGGRLRTAQALAARRSDPAAILEGSGHRLLGLSADRRRSGIARSLLRADPAERAAWQVEYLHRGIWDCASAAAGFHLLRPHRVCAHAAVDARALGGLVLQPADRGHGQ